MKHLRRTLAFLLCLHLACTASAAFAASKAPSKTFTEVPTIKFTYVPTTSTESGGMNHIDINTSLPGFLNMYLLDMSGSTVLTIAENMEIHSKDTSIDFYAIDDDGELIPPGDYIVSADMVSQFGVASKAVTKETAVMESSDPEVAALAAARASGSSTKLPSGKNAASNDSDEDEEEVDEVDEVDEIDEFDEVDEVDTGKPATSGTALASSTSSTGKTTTSGKTTVVVSDEMEYTKGTYMMGDEGLLIGVGVSDTADQADAGYWGLTADADDDQIWAALTRTMTGVDVGEKESAYIYDSPRSGRNKLGTVSGISQGLNVIAERNDGWSLVEAFRNEDGAFVRGYIKTDKLRTTEPNPSYGIVIDKETQTLTVYKDGKRLGSCKVSTGLPTPKYPHRETPAGEFILVTRSGSNEYYGMGYTKYSIRINGSYFLAEIPTTKKNGSKFLDVAEDLGEKATRGTICVAHDASTDGGINAQWIWNMTDDNKKVKVLIFDDKPRTDVPVSSK